MLKTSLIHRNQKGIVFYAEDRQQIMITVMDARSMYAKNAHKTTRIHEGSIILKIIKEH
jgi:hypothetical protein